MKIGIVTQPLYRNYGGVLQAWALQEKLRKMGHEPVTIDYLPDNRASRFIILCSWIKTCFLLCLGRRRPFARRGSVIERPEMFDRFVRKNMSLTKRIFRYKSSLVRKYGFEAVITGSDQVWRPQYNQFLPDMFLRFVNKSNVRKIAYAASFGVDNWEFTDRWTLECASLAKRLDVISVREHSGIALCKEHLGVDATEMLDPTLLHTMEDYERLCADIPRAKESYLVSYVLDLTPEKQSFIETIAAQQGLPVRIFSADSDATLSVEQWLAIYRDAQYVVTDSFHGTVFSLLFHKPFLSIVNEERGASRLYNLLLKFCLNSRLINTLDETALSDDINWNSIDERLRRLRLESTDFIQRALIDRV